MGTDDTTALELVQATSTPIHDIGSAIYLSPETFALAAEWGWANPFGFYFAGRGGMLGDVPADVVYASFGWFAPEAVRAMYEEGAGVSGSTDAARHGDIRKIRVRSWHRRHHAARTPPPDDEHTAIPADLATEL